MGVQCLGLKSQELGARKLAMQKGQHQLVYTIISKYRKKTLNVLTIVNIFQNFLPDSVLEITYMIGHINQ